MILGFKEFFDAKKTQPTWFREKILAGVGIVTINGDHIKSNGPIVEDGFKPKLHTLRLDPHDRWKAGMSIQMVYRGPKYSIKDHFNKAIPELEKCISTQTIKIEWLTYHAVPAEIFGLKGGSTRIPRVVIDGETYPSACTQVKQLAMNDGFDSLEDFYDYFNKDFTGKILHFSDMHY